jgi:hypothetical protein
MKSLFKVLVLLVTCFVVVACGQSIVTTSPIATSAMTMTPIPSQTIVTATPLPSQTATATVEPTPTENVRPTLIPTIDPDLVPELLSRAFSIQTMQGVNGHKIQQITGWDYGLGGGVFYGGMWYALCPGYQWLDTNHILLYPEAGQQVTTYGDGATIVTSVVPQLVVMNLDHRTGWALEKATSEICNRVYWSQELKILITDEFEGENSIVSTYTYDGYRLSRYPGSLWDVSPSGTKILISEDTLIDLRTNKTIKLSWSLEDYYEPHLSDLYWTYPKENRVYRCCYFYADIPSGISHRFQRSDFHDADGNHLDKIGLWFHQGEWVRDNKYFLVHWLAVDDGPVRYLPMFDPATKLFYDVWEMAGIPESFTWLYNDVSPDGNHVWIAGWGESYLVDLTTFESLHYPYPENPYTFPDTDWSADSKFVWFQNSGDKATEFQIVSIADKKSIPLPIIPQVDSYHEWHPINSVAVYPSANKDMLIFLDATTMSYRELPFALQKPPYTNAQFAWSPTGKKLALVKDDGSIWQVDYPSLENLEQLIPSLPDVRYLNWSPDGNSISFISGSGVYVVEVNK